MDERDHLQISQGIYNDIYNCDIGSTSGTFQMSYNELRETFASEPSAVVSDMVKRNDAEILGPLEIDVSEMAATTYGCDPKKSQRKSAESLCHRMALSDGAVIAMYDSSGVALRSTTTSRSCSSIGVNSYTTCPTQLSRKSKGKPENIYQLMTIANQKMSIGSRKALYETKNEKTLPMSRSVSVTTFGDLQSSGNTIASAAMSLKKFPSQLRSPRFFEPVTNLKCFVPYTPPPMLSPMRRGSGLFWKFSQAPQSKVSMQSSQGNNFDEAGTSENLHKNETDEEPIGKRLRRCITTSMQVKESSAEGQREIRTPIRKNGLCYSSQFFDTRLLHLEGLRKESNISWNSSSSSGISPGAINLSSPRKLSVSLDGETLRKISSCSDFDEEIYAAPESDAVPHINCGRDYQVKVKKWADRAISDEERDAIPDRDDAIFDCNIISHLDDSAVEAYELLAYSKAVPRPGRNRELALHLLMENKGNIQEAVLDLMRSDTLDWSQYPIIYNSIYTDTSSWTPEEISFFQDAIYKGEKDFHQVALDLGNKTVKQCVEFYYMWKKACPDDYRKLRNLRRKRQLLEMQQQLDLMESYNLRSNNRPTGSGELSGSEEGTDLYPVSHDTRKIKSGHSDRNIGSSPIVRKYSMAKFGELSHSSASSSLVMGNDGTSRCFAQSHRTPVKKGAQPAADGFFHCRLCEKYFEKVKSLNAHMKSHAMKARAEAEAAQSQLSLQHRESNIKTTNVTSILEKTISVRNSPMTDSMPFVHHHQKEQQQGSLNTDPLKPNIERQIMQVNTNFAASSAIVASEQNPFGPVIGKSGGSGRLDQDPFVQAAVNTEQHQFTQSTLMSGSLGLAAHQAFNQSLTAASVLNQFPQAQALQFLNNLQNPAITH